LKLLIITFYKLKMMLSDKLFLAAMILIPLFITIATGYALRYEKLNVIPVAFVDEDKSDYSKLLLDRLDKKEGFNIKVTTSEQALEMLKGDEIEAIFVLKKGFKEKITSGENKEIIDLVKSPSSFSSDYIGEVVAGEVMRLIANNIAADWVSKQYKNYKKPVTSDLIRDVINYTDSQWDPKPLMTINYEELQGEKEVITDRIGMPAATATSAGIIVVFVMFYILFSSGWLIEERINGTLKRLVSGPDALSYSFGASILALLISGIVQIILFSSLDKLLFGVQLFPGIYTYLVFGAYLLSVIAISLCLSAVLKTPAQLQAGAPVFALLTGFAGGCFWNFVEVPDRMKKISLLTPEGWVLDAINKQLLSPNNISAIITPLAVLIGISLILIPASYIIIRVQVRN
jgi:ABC-2 type transport system permease protein